MTLRFFWFLSDPLKCSGLAWFSPLHDVTMYHFWTNPSNTRSPRIQFSDSQVPHRENAKQILSAIGRSSQCCEIVHHEMLVYFFVNLGGAMCQTQSEKPSEPSSGLWKLVHEIHRDTPLLMFSHITIIVGYRGWFCHELEKTTWRETFIGPSFVTNPKLGISTGKWCVCHQNISKLPFITVTSDVRWALRGGTICCTFDACHIYIYSQSNIHPCIQTKFQVNISF